jgi:endonuclease III
VDEEGPVRELLQERFRGDAWGIGVSCILLTQTRREQVDEVLDKLLLYWPTPDIMADASLREVARVLASNGMSWVKAYRLIRFSDEYTRWDGERETAPLLFGLGQYALDSLDLFYYGLDTDVPSGDKELLAYVGREENR